jgi:hypothetical protein
MSSENELIPRYIIVRFGGVLGVARQRVAIPGERVDVSDDGVVVEITHEELVSAPRFDALTPLSRQDEATIRRHFSAPFYWINGTETP